MYGKLNESDLQELQQQARAYPQRLKFIIEQAKHLPEFSQALRHADDEVKGCEAQVWLKVSGSSKGYQLMLDSPSRVIKGLLALLYHALNGATAEQVKRFDLDAYFAALQLNELVSVSRRNGLRNVVARIQQQAN